MLVLLSPNLNTAQSLASTCLIQAVSNDHTLMTWRVTDNDSKSLIQPNYGIPKSCKYGAVLVGEMIALILRLKSYSSSYMYMKIYYSDMISNGTLHE